MPSIPPMMSEPNTVGQSQFSQMSSEDFVRVLFTELRNQDPLEPQDSSKLLEQLSSLRNIESQMSLQESLADMVRQNQMASAGNLIGRMVEGLDEANNQVVGIVSSVRVSGDEVVLELDTGQALPMTRVTHIAELPNGMPPAEGDGEPSGESADPLNDPLTDLLRAMAASDEQEQQEPQA